jgi:hypothetical protein
VRLKPNPRARLRTAIGGERQEGQLEKPGSEFVAVVDRVHKQKIGKLNQVSFNKIVKLPCRNHVYLVKHTLEECDIIKRYFKGDYKSIGSDALSRPASNEEKGIRISRPERVPHDLWWTGGV